MGGRKQREAGFSLTEVMVGCSVMGLVLAAAVLGGRQYFRKRQ